MDPHFREFFLTNEPLLCRTPASPNTWKTVKNSKTELYFPSWWIKQETLAHYGYYTTAKLHNSTKQNKHIYNNTHIQTVRCYVIFAMDLQKLQLHCGPLQVSNRDLKISRSAVFLIWLGSLFHKCVEYGTNVFRPLFTELQCCCFTLLANLVLWIDLSWRTNRLDIYWGARLCTHLNTWMQRALSLVNSNVGILALNNRVL